MEREGLTPSREADRATLIRRVTLDLTGLPPTPAEVEAFLNDKSPDAYEKVVDRLSADPRLRRVHGAGVAGCGTVRRHARLSHRFRPGHDAVGRVGDRGIQHEQAV